MFNKGDLIHHATNGLCLVEEITALTIPGTDPDRLYYRLAPLGQSGSVVFSPVDNPKITMRKALSAEEAEELIVAIPDITPLAIANNKKDEQAFREALTSLDCQDWVRLIKALYQSKTKKEATGKKLSAVEERYFQAATTRFHREMAAAVGIEAAQVEDYITEKIG